MAAVCVVFHHLSSPPPRPTYSYSFSQQSNPDCHLQMWANFQRLQDYRAKDSAGAGRAIIDEEDFLQHREWLGTSLIHYVNWLQAKNQPAIRDYFEDALQEAPLFPQILQYFNWKGGLEDEDSFLL